MRQYLELRRLTPTGGIEPWPLPQAAPVFEALAGDAAEPSRDLDLALLEASQAGPDPLPLLCLRCRISHALEARLRATHRAHRAQHGIELQAMAGYGLDDDGALMIRTGKGITTAFVLSELASLPDRLLSPFSADVLRSYEPARCSLTHWSRLRIQGHNDLKRYFRQHGLLLISDWALLRHSSGRRVRQACERFLRSTASLAAAVDLHRRFCPAYDAARAEHRQRSAKGSGWQPDLPFLRALAPERDPFATKELLLAIARAIGTLQSGRFLAAAAQSEHAAEQVAEVAEPASLPAAEDAWSPADLKALITAALDRAMPIAVQDALSGDQPTWAGAAERRRAWKLYGQGLGQREIAERCKHQQGWVSKLINEQRLSSTIATAAAVERLRHPAFASLTRSVEGAERLLNALRNHLITPEREGDVAPLRQAVAQTLATLHPQP